MFTPTKRVLKFAVQDLLRNFWLSVVTLTILILALFTVNLLIIFNAVAGSAIASIEQKIDVSVYFKSEASAGSVENTARYIRGLGQVQDVEYVSPEKALENFKERHKNDPDILKSLEEAGKNPLGASLIIKAKNAGDYPAILDALKDPQYDKLIESKDFDNRQLIIDRISGITGKVSVAIAVIALIFALIAILIIFNAIRMAIYTHREEIAAMKLVGATDWFVRAPYLTEGAIFALLAVLITGGLVYLLLGFIQPYIALILQNNFNLLGYFNHNFLAIFGLEFLGALIINLLSGFLAVGRYVRV